MNSFICHDLFHGFVWFHHHFYYLERERCWQCCLDFRDVPTNWLRKLVLFYFLMVEIFVALINSHMLLVSIFLLLYFCFHTNRVKIKLKVIKCNFKVKISKTTLFCIQISKSIALLVLYQNQSQRQLRRRCLG